MGLSVHVKPQKYNTVVDYRSTLLQNELRINRVSGLLDLLIFFSCFITLALDHFGVFLVDEKKIVYFIILLAPLCIFSFVISNVFKIAKPWVKYVIVINDCIIVLLANAFFNSYAVLLFVVPLLKSCLYYDYLLTRITGIVNLVCMFLSYVLSVNLSVVVYDPIVGTMYDAIVFGFLPQFLSYIFIYLIIYFLSTSSATMIGNLYNLADRNEKLVKDMRDSQYQIVNNLATISDNKSPETGDHIGRVFEYMKVLASAEGYSKAEAYDIALASMLHDIGKLCIDEKIISAPRELSHEEFEIMKQHVVFGKELLDNASSKVLQMGSIIAYEHHENYDGTGYLGIKGNDIDLFARMMSVVDVFDALTSSRSYKKAWSKKDALKELVRQKGTKFDPKVVDLFAANFDSISQICDKLNPDSH